MPLKEPMKIYVSVTFDWDYCEKNYDREEELEEIIQRDLERIVLVDGFDQGTRYWHLYLEIRPIHLNQLKTYLNTHEDFKDYIAIEI
jgi:hypothetical protein